MSESFKTAALMKDLMAKYYNRGEECRREGIPVVWVTAVFPVEIIYAMDLFPYYPENFGAVASARKVADKLSEVAERQGYFSDLCGYARCGLGDAYTSEHPVGKILPPDLLLCCNTQCGSLPKWFEAAGRFYKAPYFLWDSPFFEDEVSELSQNYLLKQLYELIEFLEVTTKRRFDFDRLREVVALSSEATGLWNDCLEMAALKPAPFGFFDACFHMAPIVTMRGTKEAVAYYRQLKVELEERLEKKIYSIPNERHKVYFDHIPVWPRLRWLADIFAAHDTLVVASQYTHAWAMNFDPARPLASLAELYPRQFVNRGFDYRIKLKMDFMKHYNCDGFVLFSNRSCKPSSLGLYDKSKMITEKTGLPGVIFEADMSDVRYFAEGQVKTLLETFFERMG